MTLAITGGNAGSISLASSDADISTTTISAYTLSAAESGNIIGGNGNKVSLNAGGNITTGKVESHADAFSDSGDITGGNGSDISLTAGGEIRTKGLVNSFSRSGSILGNGSGKVKGGDGGQIDLQAEGNISALKFGAFSVSGTSASEEVIRVGNGGDVSLRSNQGNIKTDNISSYSFSNSANTKTPGEGGAISINASQGIIEGLRKGSASTQDSSVLASFSLARSNDSGNGGAVNLTASSEIRDFVVQTASSSQNSGRVEINGEKDLLISNLDSRTTKTITILVDPPVNSKGSPITIKSRLNGRGASGNVEIRSNGILTLRDSTFQSDTNGTDDAGQYIIQSPSSITFDNTQINSETQSIGQAGSILVVSPEVLLNQSSISTSTSGSGRAGDIRLEVDALTLNDSQIRARTTSTGNSGTIALSTIEREVTAPVAQSEPVFSDPSDSSEPIAGGRLAIALNGQSEISVSTDASGQGGNLNINAPKTIEITGGGTLNAQTSATGSAGNITATAQRLTLDKGTTLSTTATATANPPANEDGSSANITLNADEMNLFGTVEILSETQGAAQAGTLTLKPNSSENLTINLADQSRVSASTSGSGQEGNINLSAPNALTIQGDGTFSAETTGTGTGGNINLTAKTVTVDQATISTSTEGPGTAGNISFNTETLTLNNSSEIRARTTGPGNSGTINLNAITPEAAATFNQQNPDLSAIAAGDRLTINLADQSEISVSTAASGQGGNLNLNAPEAIEITGNGTLTAQTSATGSAGNITATTQRLTLDEGATLSTTATATANPPANEDASSANITLSADEMNLFGTVEILSETQGAAQAGTLTLQPNTSKNLAVNLADKSRVSASTSGSGQGGSINISAPSNLTIRGDGTFSAETTGTGPGGNINLTAKNVTIDQATLQTRSAGEGLAGNITANGLTTLQMQNGSLILADAGGNANGGNITIDADFVIARPGDNNDIIATAMGGDGGRIDIDAEAILNFKLSDEPNTDTLRSNGSNDISASSQSGNDGTLNLAGLNADPTRGATQLPVTPTPPNQIDRSCSAQTTGKNDFTITGRGGIPLSPDQPLRSMSNPGQWIDLPAQQEKLSQQASAPATNTSPVAKAKSATPEIREASEWGRDRQGNITLLASQTLAHPAHHHC